MISEILISELYSQCFQAKLNQTSMRPIKFVDAFSNEPFKGNPVAVVLDAQGLSEDQMQTVARWTNLSETTFVLPPTHPNADYTLRIFTPRTELPFAGHPTLGSAHALVESGLVKPKNGILVQQCAQGFVPIRVDGGVFTLELPDAKFKEISQEDISTLESILKCKLEAPAPVDVGPTFVIGRVENIETLLGLDPDLNRLAELERKLEVTGITLFADYPDSTDIEVRTFAPSSGVSEDPVCGSGNGALAVFRKCRGLLETPSYMAKQGRKVGRDGRVYITVNSVVRVGGECVTCLKGELNV